jgi:membrane protein DedA with SNARE-associated domain
MDMLQDLMTSYTWIFYVGIFLAPFVQEDAAVIGAATASTTGMGSTPLLFATALAGLVASDTWKYWAGRAALYYPRARRFAEKPGVQAARDRVVNSLLTSLFVVRFVPGTRVPFYLACGLFKAPFIPFALGVMASGALYLGAAFALLHLLGTVAGTSARLYVGVGVVALIALIFVVRIIAKKRAEP